MRRYARFFALLSLSAAAFAQPPTIAWQHTFGGPYGNEEAYSVVQMTDGNYAAAGYSDGPLSAGMKDFYVVKFDGDGNPIWQHTYTYVGGQRDTFDFVAADGRIRAGDLPRWHRLDVAATWDLLRDRGPFKNVQIYTRVNNVFDTGIEQIKGFPDAGTTGFGGIRATF